MTDSQLAAFVQAHPGWGRIRLAKATGAAQRAIRRILAKNRAPATTQRHATAGRTLSKDDFMRRFDTDTRAIEAVRRAVRSVQAGRLISDYDLRKKVSFPDPKSWESASSGSEYQKMRIRAGDRKIYWTDKETAAELVANCSGVEYAEEGN